MVCVLVLGSSAAAAQTVEWRLVDNPYQEDVAYSIGDVYNPGVEVGGVRWHSFSIAAPDPDELRGGGNVPTEVALRFENRQPKSAKVLVILLLEDSDGAPLERVEIRRFKVPASRMKDRVEDIALPARVFESAERVYLFFEVID